MFRSRIRFAKSTSCTRKASCESRCIFARPAISLCSSEIFGLSNYTAWEVRAALLITHMRNLSAHILGCRDSRDMQGQRLGTAEDLPSVGFLTNISPASDPHDPLGCITPSRGTWRPSWCPVAANMASVLWSITPSRASLITGLAQPSNERTYLVAASSRARLLRPTRTHPPGAVSIPAATWARCTEPDTSRADTSMP